MSQDLHLKNAKKNRSVKLLIASLVRLTSQRLISRGLRLQELEYFPALVTSLSRTGSTDTVIILQYRLLYEDGLVRVQLTRTAWPLPEWSKLLGIRELYIKQ